MELLIFLLLSPAIFADKQHKNFDPNQEPFLPIYPVYPYSPRFIKRGIERDAATQQKPENFASKQESYIQNFNGNIPRDPYHSLQDSLPKISASRSVLFSSPYSSVPYNSVPFTSGYFGTGSFNSASLGPGSINGNPYAHTPYKALNSYSSVNPTTPIPQSLTPFAASAFPNSYQPPVYYPNYQNQPYLSSQLPPSNLEHFSKDNDDVDHDDADTLTREENYKKSAEGGKHKGSNSSEHFNVNFVDGANYLSTNSQDLDSQSTTYKFPGTYAPTDSQIPYKLIGITGQSENFDHPSTATLIKPEQLEQLMRQTLIKLLSQNNGQQVNQIQYPIYDTNQQTRNRNTMAKNIQTYVTVSNAITKSGLPYIANPTIATKKLSQNSAGHAQQTQELVVKNQRHPDSQPPQKLITHISVENSQSIYIPPTQAKRNETFLQLPDYGSFETESSPVAESHGTFQSQDHSEPASNKNKILVTLTPSSQTQSDKYSSYQAPPSPKPSDRIIFDDISIKFANKKESKR